VKKIHPLLLSALSGLLLFAAWPMSPLTFLIFFAFIPLLWIEGQGTRGGRFFGLVYLTMLLWNLATTWWVCNATLIGGLSAILPNSLLMCLPWLLFYHTKKRFGARLGYVSLVAGWLCFEYIHLNWELSWPWLTLGNVFATHPDWVQWYEFTGCSGGSLWVLLVNLLLFGMLRRGFGRLRIVYIILLIPIPFMVSRLLASNIAEQTAATGTDTPDVVVVQPNIDPYNEKFVENTQDSQLIKLISLSESQVDAHTALVVWPETAIPRDINERELEGNPYLAPVWHFLGRHPHLDLLTGVEGFRLFSQHDKTSTSIPLQDSGKYMESYNSAVLMNQRRWQIYHKSKLVPGVETIPSFLRFMIPLFEKFGGTGSGYTGQSERTVMTTMDSAYHIAPAVCYESIYGAFLSSYVKRGADLIVVITNDGWWGNTPGYHQHENYARLRAIEERRWVVRSANTGISCFIDPSGRVIDPQPWDTTEVIKMRVPANKGLTFYARYGDIISVAAMGLTIPILVCLLFVIIKRLFKRG
jgi:apolipoprotein N-acyltransferase